MMFSKIACYNATEKQAKKINIKFYNSFIIFHAKEEQWEM